MNISTDALLLYSIFGAVILFYLPFLLVAYARIQIGYEMMVKPRALLDKLPPYAQRANWAHQNSFEAFVIYTAAAFTAYLTGVNSSLATVAIVAFLVARLLYSLFYILNIPLLRSLMFGIGSLSSITLFTLSFIQINTGV